MPADNMLKRKVVYRTTILDITHITDYFTMILLICQILGWVSLELSIVNLSRGIQFNFMLQLPEMQNIYNCLLLFLKHEEDYNAVSELYT